jgi:hypothetical protein
MRLITWLRRYRKPKSKAEILLREITNLERKMLKVELHMDRLEDQFWRDGGGCCPGCGMPGYSDLQSAQDRRERWMKILQAKLAKITLGICV